MKKNKFFVPLNRNWKKLLLTMKLCLLFLLISAASLMANSGYSQTTLSIHLKNATLRDLISEVEKQSEFIFVFYDKVVDLDQKIDVNVEGQTIDKILDQIFKSSELTYRIFDRQIGIGKRNPVTGVIELPAPLEELMAADKKLTGVVKDIKGEPIPGATVIVKGTTIGTITDFNGNFTLDVPLDAKILAISFVGFKTQEISISNKTSFSIILEEETVGLEDVVVVGYGTQTKASVVGSISTINTEKMKTIAPSNLTNAIGGNVSGVMTKMGEGKPGNDDAQIFIRGRATTNSTAPLVLVDGIESDFGRINPNDIESFSVLKDASATAVYGVRGANGVILITTKRGNTGKPKIEVNSQIRVHEIIKYPNFLDSYDYARLYNEAYLNGGNTSKFYSDADLAAYRDHTDPYGHPDVNWFKALTKPYFMEQNDNISIRGGTEKVKYYLSGEIVSQNGAYRQWSDQKYNSNSTYDRMNIRMNFDFAVTKTTNLNLSISNRIEKTNDVNSGTIGEVSTRTGLWDEISNWAPNTTPLNNPDGSFGYLNAGTGTNPYLSLRAGGFTRGRANFLQTSFNLNQKLDFVTQGLAFKMMGGMNTTSNYRYTLTELPAVWHYNPTNETYTEISRATLPSISVGNDNLNQLYHFESALNYDRTFNVHKFTALVVYNQDRMLVGAIAPVNHLGIASRITYGYKNKYLGEINVGYNGSDQFQKGQRYALLPAASLGWVVSEENFWKEHFNFIKYIKLRGSYGTAGNDKLGNFAYLYKSVYNRKVANNITGGYYFGENATGVYGISEGSLGNDHVTWEIAVKQNYGTDFNLFSNDLSFSFDYFIENRSNILSQRNTITNVIGVPSSALPPENIGKVENKGFELETRYHKKWNDWEFNFSGNISFAKNKIIDMDEVKKPYDYMNRTGKSIGQMFGYQWSGKFYSYEDLGYVWDPAVTAANKYILPSGAKPLVPTPLSKVYPGELRFVDRNGDGVIDSYDIGAIKNSSTPDFIYGLNLGINYKRFGLQMFWQGAGGFSVDFGQTPLLTEFKTGGPVSEIHLGRWAYFPEDGIDTRATATYPRLMFNGAPQTQLSSSFKVYNCTYIRLKNVELSYSLPESLIKPLKMEYARIFLTGNNLITIDNVGFFDPEAPGSQAAYPQSLFVGAGINIGF